MPQFRYTVVNKENKQLSGIVNAPGVDDARKDLQDLGFSIVSLEPMPETKEEEAGTVFEFAGRDPHNKRIKGTIRSEDRYTAYKRLIKEYDLEVEYIVQSDLKPAEKAKQKKTGVRDLLVQYQKEIQEKTNMFHKEKIKTIDRNFEREKALVMRQVDFVVKKVKDAIDTFADELNPQDKQTIKNYVNKILRIKSSTNLEYIKNECKKLLEFLQNAEIFVHKKRDLNKKVKLFADANKMIKKIEKGKEFTGYEDLEDKIVNWKKDNINNREDIPLQDKLINFFLTILLRFIHEDDEIRYIKKQIKEINKDIKQYYSVYLKNKSNEYRQQASKSIKKLKDKRKELKNQLKVIRENIKNEEKAEHEKSFFESLLEIINGVTGWLLFFYIAFYIISNYIIAKQLFFAQENIPGIFYLFRTGSVKYVLPIIFLLHITTSMKMSFFRKNLLASAVLFPAFFVASLLVLFNF
jgi:hypothetical protein